MVGTGAEDELTDGIAWASTFKQCNLHLPFRAKLKINHVCIGLRVQPAAAPPAAPLGEVGVSWPSLGDAKAPVKKKERPETAAGASQVGVWGCVQRSHLAHGHTWACT
eukprot:1145447-Pelagomonas_calceolata.AAC.4